MDELLKHLKEHITTGSTIICPFDNCAKYFSKKSTFSAHVSRNHKSNYLHLQSTNKDSSHDSTDNRQPDIDNSSTLEEIAEMQETSDKSNLFLRNLTLLFLKLQTKFLIPSSTG